MLLIIFVGNGCGAVDFFDSLLKMLNFESISREDGDGDKQREFVFRMREVILKDLASRFGGCLDCFTLACLLRVVTAVPRR
jgi:hypothetical protein